MLREYQQSDVKNIYSAWDDGNKNVMYRLETGGGKTQVVSQLILNFLAEGKRVMFIAHREELITQAWNTFYRHKIYSGIVKAGVAPNFSLPCQIGSIQTLTRRAALPKADVVLIDESHHAIEDNTYGKVLKTHYPDALVLGVTATTYRLNGKGFTKLFDCLVESVVSRADLIRMGFLVPMKYFAAFTPDMTGVKITAGDYNEEDSSKAMELAPIVESYFEHCDGLAGIVFAVNVAHSLKIVSQYRQAGVNAAHIDANTPAGERAQILKAFKEKRIKVLSNVGIATEGFDMPGMDFAQLARPSLSLSLVCQMVGRAGRVDNDVIKNCSSDEERNIAIAASQKPFGIILDNAGLFTKHHSLIAELTTGTPIIWANYFLGFSKKEKKKIEEFIEIEYIAEDKDGARVVGRHPEEVEGMKLIEITRGHKEKLINISCLNEFERNYEMFKRMPDKIQKPGFAAFYKFIEYCKRNNIEMTDGVWSHLQKRLVDDHKDALTAIKEKSSLMTQAIHEKYKDDDREKDFLLSEVTTRSEKQISAIAKISVPSSFLKKQRSQIVISTIPIRNENDKRIFRLPDKLHGENQEQENKEIPEAVT